MAGYKTLFTVSVAHAYFAGGWWQGLDFALDQATAKLVAGADLLVRRTEHGIGVFFDPDKLLALRLLAAGDAGVLGFRFKMRAQDRTFETYTSPSFRQEGKVLLFRDQGTAADGATGGIRLGKREVASMDDLEDIDALVAEGALTDRESRVPPDFIMDLAVPLEDAVDTPRAYLVRFDARQAFWKYYLLGNAKREQAFIVDLDSQVEFLPCGEALLPGNKSSVAFRSKERIPISERSGYRFQLREQVNGVTRTLVKRLPVASESRLGRDTIDGKPEIILECFVNF